MVRGVVFTCIHQEYNKDTVQWRLVSDGELYVGPVHKKRKLDDQMQDEQLQHQPEPQCQNVSISPPMSFTARTVSYTLKNNAKVHRDSLLEAVELEYTQHIDALIKQKKLITQNIVQICCAELRSIHNK